MKQHIKGSLLAISLATLGFADASNGATTGEIFNSGNACRTSGGTLIRTLVAGYNGVWANDHTTNSMGIDCAIPVSSSVTVKSADFYVMDASTTSAVSCFVTNYTGLIPAGGFSATATTAAGESTGNVVTFNANVTDSTPGFVVIHCDIPPKSGANRSGFLAAQIVQ